MTQIGFWPDPPSRRWAYDDDGTIVLNTLANGSYSNELTLVQKQAMNDEGDSYFHTTGTGFGTTTNQYIVFIFPEKRNLTHYYAAVNKTYHYAGAYGTDVQYSNDTSNGIDGNWITVASSWQINSNNANGAFYPLTTPGFPDMRTNIEALPVNGARAIRFGIQSSHGNDLQIRTLQLYGHKTAGATPHRIDFVYSDGSELVQDFDYGDQPRGSDRIWSTVNTYNIGSALYLRNRSPNKMAQDVVITLQNLSGTMVNRLSLSKDNVTYGTQLTYTQIQPLQTVGPIYVKHAVPDTTPMGLYTARLRLVVGTWF